jgi:hypothetical protein
MLAFRSTALRHGRWSRPLKPCRPSLLGIKDFEMPPGLVAAWLSQIYDEAANRGGVTPQCRSARLPRDAGQDVRPRRYPAHDRQMRFGQSTGVIKLSCAQRWLNFAIIRRRPNLIKIPRFLSIG